MEEYIKNPDSFIFYRSFLEAIEEADEASQLQLYRAIAIYALNREEPELRGMVKAVWMVIKPQIDANFKRYVNGCKGAPHGKKGGAPKGNTNALKQPRNNPETTPNKNYNEKKNYNINESSTTTTNTRGVAAVAAVGVQPQDLSIEEFLADEAAVESFCMANKVSIEDFRRIAEEVLIEWRLTGQTHTSEADARRHLLSQTRIKIDYERKEKQRTQWPGTATGGQGYQPSAGIPIKGQIVPACGLQGRRKKG